MSLHDLFKAALSQDKGRPLFKGDWDESKHPRDKDGKFGTGGSDGPKDPVIERMRVKGGFSYNPVTGEIPVTGFAVSPYPERSQAIDVEKFTRADLTKYDIVNQDLLDQPNHLIGGWVDRATGKVVLDVSIVVGTHEEAQAICGKHDQKAYYDLAEKKEYMVNEHATSGGVLKGDANYEWQSVEAVDFGASGPQGQGEGFGCSVRKTDGKAGYGAGPQGISGHPGEGGVMEKSIADLIKDATAQGKGRPLIKGLTKRDFSAKERDKAADSGVAMPDGSFPIKNVQDLRNAVSLVGRAKDPTAAKHHIIERARVLGAVDQLPEAWGVQKADWDESQHPRDESGKFSDGGGPDKAGDTAREAKKRPIGGVLSQGILDSAHKAMIGQGFKYQGARSNKDMSIAHEYKHEDGSSVVYTDHTQNPNGVGVQTEVNLAGGRGFVTTHS